jgi:hypothetical protein
VSPGAAGEAVTLHNTGETTALGTGDNVYQLPHLKHVYRYLLAYFKLADVVGLDFPKVPDGLNVLQVPGPGLVQALDGPKAQLDRLITVASFRLDLRNGAGAGFNNGYRHH